MAFLKGNAFVCEGILLLIHLILTEEGQICPRNWFPLSWLC